MRSLGDHINRPALTFCFSFFESISSWIGFEVGLLNTELEKIVEYVDANGMELTIKNSGFSIFLQSIKYRYYPIFMLVLMMILIFSQRDFGPMLLAERQIRVYDRTDGGPNKGKTSEIEASGQNQPREDQPLLAVNMLLPVLILVGIIFWALVQSGDDGSGTQTFMQKIEASDSFLSLLYGVSAPMVCVVYFRKYVF
jgi:Na+/H+ antiporter NhaC